MAFTRSKFDTCNLSKVCNENNKILDNILDSDRHTNSENCFFSTYPINKKANLKNVNIESNLFNLGEPLRNCDNYSEIDKLNKLPQNVNNINSLVCKNTNHTEYTKLNPLYSTQLISPFNAKLSPYVYSNDSLNNGFDTLSKYQMPVCNRNNSNTQTCAFNGNNLSKIGLNTSLDSRDKYQNELNNLKKLDSIYSIEPQTNILNSNNNSNLSLINCQCTNSM